MIAATSEVNHVKTRLVGVVSVDVVDDQTRTSPDFLIVARTDARTNLGPQPSACRLKYVSLTRNLFRFSARSPLSEPSLQTLKAPWASSHQFLFL